MTITSGNLFPTLPKDLREELVNTFNSISRNYREGRWEPSELNGGKFCEVVYSIIKGYLDGSFPPKATKPRNMLQSCQSLEQYPSTSGPRSVRIQIPRMIVALYEIRNNRGVGHVGGDVNPNNMDSTCVLYMCKWMYAELIRLFHNVTLEEATAIVNAVTERVLPIIWKINGVFRVLDTSLTMKEKTLLLLFSQSESIQEPLLFKWVEHSNSSVYRRDVLKPLHKSKLIEYDQDKNTVTISPLGTEKAELLLQSSSWSFGA
ncbi:MAG: hypothetical protein WBB69_08475 [Anaerolineales bacterium]